MTPELRALIYGTIASVIAAIVIAGAKLALDRFNNRKSEPIDRGKKITELADAVVDVSTAAVVGIRAQLTDALTDLTKAREALDARGADLEATRAELEAARVELRQTKAMMERREQDHRGALGRLRNRITQLVEVLTLNNIEVPPPAEEIDLDLDGDPTAVPA